MNLEGRLRLHHDVRHGVLRIGMEREPVLLVDNLFAEPHLLAEYAATLLPRFGAADAFYPGLRCPAPPICAFALRAFLKQQLAEAFALDVGRIVRERCEFSIVTQAPDTLAIPQRLPHVDAAGDRLLAMVLYLDDPLADGTAFFRHRATGFETIDAARLDRYRGVLLPEVAAAPPAARYVDPANALFEPIGAVSGVANRLVAYRGKLLHGAVITPDRPLPAAPPGWRLTLNSFFEFG